MHGHSVSESSSLNKNAHNKYLIIPLVLILVIGSFFSSVNSAKANPLALAAGIEVGAGVYVTAALLVAGGAALVGYDEHSEEVKAHAKRVWDGANQTVRDSLTASMAAAVGAGNKVVEIAPEFLNYVDGQLDKMAIEYATYSNSTIINGSYRATNSIDGFADAQLVADQDIFVADNPAYARNNLRVQVFPVSGDIYITLPGGQVYFQYAQHLIHPNNLVPEVASLKTIEQFNAFTRKVMNAAGQLAAYQPVRHIDLSDIYKSGVSKTREQWESMRDAGLVLPVDSAIPHANGQRATYNPTDGTYTGVDGGVINPSDVTWSFPVPRYRDKDVPVPGVYVDTPPLTGVPSIDDAIVKNPAIPKTTTNVNTGVTILNPDIPKEANPPIEGEIPGGEVPPTTPTTPKAPGTQPIIPIAILLALFDLLRAILMYLSRMFAFLVTIPFVVAIPIDNPYFQWFRTATILGVQPYPLVMSTAAFFMSFAAYKSIRRLLP